MSNGRSERRSIFGGVLLILIGVLFLLRHHIPGFDIGRLFATFWPVLLILWGLAKLYDNFAAGRSSEGRPPLLSGGELALLLFLIFIGCGFLLRDKILEHHPDFNIHIGNIGDVWNWNDGGTPVREELPPQPLKANSVIRLQTIGGDITVFADEASDLRVVATKTAPGRDDAESRQRGEAVSVAINATKDGFEVRPGGKIDGHIRVDYEVHVPKSVSLSAQTDKGDISISGITGEVSASTAKGDVEIHDSGGNVNASVQSGDARISDVRGDVRLEGNGNGVDLSNIGGDATIQGEFFGPIQIANVGQTTHFASSRTDLTVLRMHGRIDLDSGSLQISDVAGSVKLATRNKDVTVENSSGRIEIANAHGDISVSFEHAPKDEISITNDSGGVDLSLPSQSSFEVAASSRSGDVQTDFDRGTLNTSNQGDTSRLDGKVGARGPKISIVTSYGTINLHKSDS